MFSCFRVCDYELIVVGVLVFILLVFSRPLLLCELCVAFDLTYFGLLWFVLIPFIIFFSI